MFVKLSDQVWASPQIGVAEVGAAAAQGIGLIINNRPEGESADQTPGSGIEVGGAGRRDGLCRNPRHPMPASAKPQVDGDGRRAGRIVTRPVLAYCRSGTRSTLLWALGAGQARRQPRRTLARQGGRRRLRHIGDRAPCSICWLWQGGRAAIADERRANVSRFA